MIRINHTLYIPSLHDYHVKMHIRSRFTECIWNSNIMIVQKKRTKQLRFYLRGYDNNVRFWKRWYTPLNQHIFLLDLIKSSPTLNK